MILPLTIDLAMAIAPHLRESDRAEIIAAEGAVDNWQAWGERYATLDGTAFAGLLDGTPFVMGGFTEIAGAGNCCCVWMVATDAITVPRGTGIAARLVMLGHRLARKKYQYAIACSDYANVPGMRLLLKLGYEAVGDLFKRGGRDFVHMRVAL